MWLISRDRVPVVQPPAQPHRIRDAGNVDLVRNREDGTEELLITIQPGGYFGELAPLFGLRRAAAARAAGPATVTGYTMRDFRARHSGSVGQLLSGAVDSTDANL
jgi:CRP-like cAMP-binding protein